MVIHVLKPLKMRCCVPFCKTTAGIVSETKENTFHEFPREVHLRAAWLRALGKQDALLPAGAVVCSLHFLNDEFLETENGSRQIRTGAVPATVLICLVCVDSRNKLLLMSEHKLEQAYHHLVGHRPCGRDRLKHTVCVQCAQRLVDFSTFRDESLRARCLITELLHTHEVITRRHVALLSRYKRTLRSDIEPDTAPDATATVAASTVAAATATDATDVAVAVKQEVGHREDVNTAACATRRHVALLNRYKRTLPSDIEPDTAPDATATVAASTVAAATATDATDVAVAVKQEVGHREDVNTAACATRRHVALLSRYKRTLPSDIEPDTAPDATATVAASTVAAATATDATDVAVAVKQEVGHREDVNTAACATRRHVALLSRYKRTLPSDIEPDTAPDATATVAASTVAAATATDATDVAVAVKQEVGHREDVNTAACAYNADGIATAGRALREHCKALEYTPAAAEAATETQTPIKREHSCEPESSGDHNQALVAPVVLATNSGNVEHPTEFSDDWDISSFEKNAKVLEDPRNAELISKESLAKISDNIDYRTRRDDRLKNAHRKHSQGMFSTLLGNHTDRTQYICDVCQKIFQRKVSLVSHIRVHAFAESLSCNQNHTLSSHKTMRTEDPFACKLCKYKCTVRSNVVTHMSTLTGEKPFGCKLCKSKFTRKSYLVKHMRTHTGEKPFSCNLCVYKCTDNYVLVKHMRTHSGEKPFVCELCKYKSAQKGHLVKHMRTHSGEKPFACELCKYKCSVKFSLVRHMRTHTGEKPFVCELCKYKCAQQSHLVKHMRTHSGEKPFACELCKYKSTVNSHLVRHMRTHTGGKPFSSSFASKNVQ